MLIIGETKYRVYGNSFYHVFSFSVNLTTAPKIKSIIKNKTKECYFKKYL